MPPETAVAEDQLAALLAGDFLLTDARGNVSRFGRRASALFGWRSEEIIGRAVLEALAVPGSVEKWRKRLATPENPLIGVVQGRARHVDGQEFNVEWLLVPVWLRHSLELSRMLEVIGADVPPESKLERLERDHSAALAAVRAAIAGGGAETDDDRLAGFVLAFRALGDTPWADAALAPAEPAPEPLAAAAVGPNDEQLLRVGGVEQELEVVRAELAELRTALADAQAAAEQALALSEETRMEAENWRRELAERSREEVGETVPAAGQNGRVRDARPGFDDVAEAQALIALDGRFTALNPAFCELVGYTEMEFRRARWPSLADRDNLVDHRRLQAELAAGEIDRARIETMYLHGQGLMVPVLGTLELVREDGRPSHLLLRVSG